MFRTAPWHLGMPTAAMVKAQVDASSKRQKGKDS